MKEFVGKTLTRKVAFMDGEVEIRVLTVADIKEIEKETKDLKDEDSEEQLGALHFIIRKAVIGAEDLTDEELDGFPVSELTRLSEEIMGVREGND